MDTSKLAKEIRKTLLDLCALLDEAHIDHVTVQFKLNPITGERYKYCIEELILSEDYTLK